MKPDNATWLGNISTYNLILRTVNEPLPFRDQVQNHRIDQRGENAVKNK